MDDHIFHTIPGESVLPADLPCHLAKALAEALLADRLNYATLVQCIVPDEDSGGVVVLDIQVEVAQVKVNAIAPLERVAVVFDRTCSKMPAILALRMNFPLVPHLNLQPEGLPKSICLYAKAFEEIALHWTPERFIADLRVWLADTADGTLHREGQALEPLLVGSEGTIILPHDIHSQLLTSSAPKLMRLVDVAPDRKRFMLVAHVTEEATDTKDGHRCFAATALLCPPQTHGIIKFRPATFRKLCTLLGEVGCDLQSELSARLRDWYGHGQLPRECCLVIIIMFPVSRYDGTDIEELQTWAFLMKDNIGKVGVDLGLWGEVDGSLGVLIGEPSDSSDVDFPILTLNPISKISRLDAASLSGREPFVGSIVAIGIGALGSQVFMSLHRSGFGRWTLIDYDHFLPHNAVRHLLVGGWAGCNKSEQVARLANMMFDGPSDTSSIAADVLHPKDRADEIRTALGAADLIIDMSASLPVARHITHTAESTAPRISVFLNPQGDDLVLLSEGEGRNNWLDSIEMQYYRAVSQEPELIGHLDPPAGSSRYGLGCRDVTFSISQDYVGLHAALASIGIRHAVQVDGPRIFIWRASDQGLVTRIDIDSPPTFRHQIGDWTIVSDRWLATRLGELRAQRLPNETGGALVGSIDFAHRVVYIVDTVHSPADSVETPAMFIRGTLGLEAQLREIGTRTAGMLEYIGEWHSHPPGVAPLPSSDDRIIFRWLQEEVCRSEGLPPVMLIVSDDGQIACTIDAPDTCSN